MRERARRSSRTWRSSATRRSVSGRPPVRIRAPRRAATDWLTVTCMSPVAAVDPRRHVGRSCPRRFPAGRLHRRRGRPAAARRPGTGAYLAPSGPPTGRRRRARWRRRSVVVREHGPSRAQFVFRRRPVGFVGRCCLRVAVSGTEWRDGRPGMGGRRHPPRPPIMRSALSWDERPAGWPRPGGTRLHGVRPDCRKGRSPTCRLVPELGAAPDDVLLQLVADRIVQRRLLVFVKRLAPEQSRRAGVASLPPLRSQRS